MLRPQKFVDSLPTTDWDVDRALSTDGDVDRVSVKI